jgi:hypothetical protein
VKAASPSWIGCIELRLARWSVVARYALVVFMYPLSPCYWNLPLSQLPLTGVSTSVRFSFAFLAINECNQDTSPTIARYWRDSSLPSRSFVDQFKILQHLHRRSPKSGKLKNIL